MARILQSLVCFTVMMTSARTQRGYFYHHTYQGGVVYPAENPNEGPQGRIPQPDTRPISENLSRRSGESRKYRFETLPQGLDGIENGTYKILNRLHLNKRGALEESITNPNDRVVFPGPTSKVSPSYQPQIPEECRKKGFCENVPNYPTEYIEKLVTGLGEAVNRFQMDMLDEEDIQIAQRLGGTGTEQEIELCNFTEKIIYPESAPDKDNNWYTVLNLKEKPLQGFRAEMCSSSNSGCNAIASIQEGYKGGCKQKYVYRMMEALDKNGNHVQKSLKLPSCCSCVITVNNPFKR